MKHSIGQKKPFTKKQISTLKKILLSENNLRDYCLFSMGIDTMLRSSDLLKLTVADVVDHNEKIKKTFDVQQKKTGNTNTVQLQDDTMKQLKVFIDATGKCNNEFLFTGRKMTHNPISYVQHSRLVKKWTDFLGLDVREYSTHSVRRSKSSIIYGITNNVEVCRQLLGQSNCTATSRYLGIGKQDALRVGASIVL